MEERDDLSRDILKVSGVVLAFFSLLFVRWVFWLFCVVIFFGVILSLSGFFYFLPCISLGDRDFVPPAVWSPNGSIETTGSSGSHSLSPLRTSTHMHAPRSRVSRGVFKNILSVNDVIQHHDNLGVRDLGLGNTPAIGHSSHISIRFFMLFIQVLRFGPSVVDFGRCVVPLMLMLEGRLNLDRDYHQSNVTP